MKQNFFVFAVFFTAFAGLIAFSAQAQDNHHPEVADELKELSTNHPELKLDEDKTLITEPETKTNNFLSPAGTRENVATKNGGKGKDVAKTEKEEDDALGFNFLYYIIQKFKIGDIVDH